MPTKSKKNSRYSHPGVSGRPEKPDKNLFMQVCCVLRKDTVARLRAGAGGTGRHFGEFLQSILDRRGIPTREQYLAQTMGVPYYTLVKRKKVPTIMAAAGQSKEAKKLERERARREKLTPQERAWEDALREGVKKVVQEAYANQS